MVIVPEESLQFVFGEIRSLARSFYFEISDYVKPSFSFILEQMRFQARIKNKEVIWLQSTQTSFGPSWVSVGEGVEFWVVVGRGYPYVILPGLGEESPKGFLRILSNNFAVGPAKLVPSFWNWNVFEGVIGKERPEDPARSRVDAHAKEADFHLNILDRTKSNQLACPALRSFVFMKHSYAASSTNALQTSSL